MPALTSPTDERPMSTATGTLSIDLSALRANWRTLCAAVEDTPAAVIKADAYGLGAEAVGKTLYAAGCREFFLATLEEALTARSFLPDDALLYVLGGARPGEERECINAGLIPVLSSSPAIDRWAAVCRSADVASPSVIKVDTGMTRLGLSVEDWNHWMGRREILADCHPVVFMSHLACADEPDHPMNRQQQRRFAELSQTARALFPDIRCSLANSSGVFLGTDWHFDLARPGASLYGFDPLGERGPVMETVVTLKLPVLQVRDLQEPSSIGYGAEICLPAGRRLAVVAGGYADGLNRTIGREGGVGYLGEVQVPVVGRISMDTTIFDITDAPFPASPDSAYITVLDHRLRVADISHRTGALGYEVLTSLAGRYRRTYRGRDL